MELWGCAFLLLNISHLSVILHAHFGVAKHSSPLGSYFVLDVILEILLISVKHNLFKGKREIGYAWLSLCYGAFLYPKYLRLHFP